MNNMPSYNSSIALSVTIITKYELVYKDLGEYLFSEQAHK
jgi:hypothetical protein